MIYFIRNEADGAYIYPNRRKSGASALEVIKKICYKHLTSFEGYMQSVKKLGLGQYKIPIVLSKKHAFFGSKGFRNPNNIWINFMAIHEIVYYDESVLFIFDENYQLNIKISTIHYQRLVSVIFKLLEYKESLE